MIEAVPESLELKRELFKRLVEAVSDDCVLATNTSSLPVTAIAGGLRAPQRVVGMHFFNPAPGDASARGDRGRGLLLGGFARAERPARRWASW